jgi:hypothetical protein
MSTISGESTHKRIATSPAEKVPVTKKHVHTPVMPLPAGKKPQTQAVTLPKDPSKGSLIKFEVVSINDKQFYGSLAEVEILHIWEKVLGRSKDEIFGMSYNRSLTRNFKVTIKLTCEADACDLSSCANLLATST